MPPTDLRETGTKGTGTKSQMDSHTTAGKTSRSIGTRSSGHKHIMLHVD